MSTLLTEAAIPANWLSANEAKSRERFTLSDPAATVTFTTGTILAAITATGRLAEHDLGAVDGTEVVANIKGILLESIDVVSGETPDITLISQLADVRREGIQWHASVDTTAERDAVMAHLRLENIIEREANFAGT